MSGEGSQGAALPAYLPQLDALRTVALLLVVATHWLGYEFIGNPLFDVPEAVARIGWTGVDLFFVLSGFLITGILLDTRGAPNYFSGFYARRSLRILPLYYAVLVLLIFVLPQVPALGAMREFQAYSPRTSWWHFAFLTNLAEGLGYSNSRLLVPYWSLAVEEHFYLMWPLLVFRFPHRVRQLCVGGIVTSCGLRIVLLHGLGSSERLIGFLTPCRLDSLLVGALIAVQARSGPAAVASMQRWAWRILPAAALGMVGVFAAQEAQGRYRFYPTASQNPWVVSVGFLVIAAFYGSIVVLAIYGRLGVWLAARRGMVALGRITFCLYLIHEPVHVVVAEFARRQGLAEATTFGLGGAAVHLSAFAVAVGLAALSWVCFEKPILGLKRYFPREGVIRDS